MRAREASSASDDDELAPVLDETGSDSAMLDNALELLVRNGRDVRHAAAMLVPEAWEGNPELDEDVRAFYRYHACLIEPWDGPAGLVFTDGRVVGATLDRNGLRPLRVAVCDDGLVVCSSEAGTVDFRRRHAVSRAGSSAPARCSPSIPPGAVSRRMRRSSVDSPSRRPYGRWLRRHLGSARSPASRSLRRPRT